MNIIAISLIIIQAMITWGLPEMIRAVQKYLKEVKRATTPRGIEHTEKLLLWDFTKEETLRQWSCTCDEEVKGLSRARFEPNGKGDPLINCLTRGTQLHVCCRNGRCVPWDA